jgi:hypothetical protein
VIEETLVESVCLSGLRLKRVCVLGGEVVNARSEGHGVACLSYTRHSSWPYSVTYFRRGHCEIDRSYTELDEAWEAFCQEVEFNGWHYGCGDP